MLALIPLPYRLLGAMILALALFAGGFGYGVKVTKDHAAVKQLAAERLAAEQYRAEVARGNDLSARLSVAESTIQIKTIERIKYVQKVTTGKPCLEPAAVDLINGVRNVPVNADTGEATGKLATESSRALAASDADVAAWAVEANGFYDVCAARHNALVDFETGRVP